MHAAEQEARRLEAEALELLEAHGVSALLAWATE